MNNAVPGWSGGDIYRDRTQERPKVGSEPKLTNLVSLPVGGVSFEIVRWYNMPQGDTRPRIVFANNQKQYEEFVKDTMGREAWSQSQFVRITAINGMRGKALQRDQVLFLEGWQEEFNEEEVRDALQPCFWKCDIS